MWDTAKGYRVGQKSGRILRTFTKDTLLNPNKQASEKVKNRTGHKSDLLNSGPQWLRRLIAAIPAGVEAIPVTRGAGLRDLKDFLRRGKERFNAGLAVAIFSQETRNKDGRLVNPMPGAALLAQNNPDIPIYTMSISKSPKGHHRVFVGEPFTYNQMLIDPLYGNSVKTSFTVFLNDRLADHLDPGNKDDWYANQRSLALSSRKP